MLRNCATPPPPPKKMKRKTHASAIEMNWREREGNATRTRTRTHLPHPFTAAQTKLKTKKLHRFLTCGSETYASRIEIIEPTKRSRTHSPSFESVLALAPNGAAAKNSTTTPMAAPAMSAPDCGFSSSSPPNPPLRASLHRCTISPQAPRNRPAYYMAKEIEKEGSPFLFHSFCMLVLLLFSLWCQQARN